MNSEKELIDAIKDLLKKNGHLNKLQAEMRAKVTEVLQERQVLNSGDRRSAPPPTEEVLLVNELVREYLEWNGYLYTASVMASEAAMPNEKKTRSQLCSEVGVRDDEKSSALPLLSNIVAAYTERIKRKINKCKK
ncbi:centrosomal protein 20-like, partial [Galleria mellonella]|uniref:Centrosomal protein 20-like n=1 Tax=Galleria mellonella TaxID=7137 RepID=A0A6J3C9C3_GALME